jgi:hypothetical protein
MMLTRVRALIERLSSIEHDRWSDWQAYMHGLCRHVDHDIHASYGQPGLPQEHFVIKAGSLIIPPDKVAHWDKLIATKYDDLPGHSKQSDRDQVMRYWPIIVDYFHDYVTELGETHIGNDDAERCAACLRIENTIG